MISLSAEQLDYIRKIVVNPLKRHGARVYCFGSRARGDAAPFSDLDLMVVADSPLKSELTRIREELEEGSFPYVVELVEEETFLKSYGDDYLAERVEL